MTCLWPCSSLWHCEKWHRLFFSHFRNDPVGSITLHVFSWFYVNHFQICLDFLLRYTKYKSFWETFLAIFLLDKYIDIINVWMRIDVLFLLYIWKFPGPNQADKVFMLHNQKISFYLLNYVIYSFLSFFLWFIQIEVLKENS